MGLQQITPPIAEPMTLTEAKLHLRVDTTDDDALIGSLITAAREFAETETKKQLVAARWKAVFDRFPGQFCNLYDYPQFRQYTHPDRYCIGLQRNPVRRVVSIVYIDADGATQTLDAANYTVDLTTDPARIAPAYGCEWPEVRRQIAAVVVTFDAGYAAPITADATADTVTVSNWTALIVGDVVRFSNSGGALPGGLSALTDYYVRSVVSAGVYTLSASSGGALLDLTSAGTGTSYIGVIPAGLLAWMKVRLGGLYENREEVAQGVTIAPLPFVDRLLDGFRSYGF